MEYERENSDDQTETGESYEESYDYLVLSPGARAWKPEIEGIHLDNIFTLKTIPDMDRIIEKLEKTCCKRAAVIGGGLSELKQLKI
ncbi:Coenzyme A disulfide reductase [Fusobacterium necrophorum subsp. necrophorum]|nr:Coenzyme A disulfide reductase [Fusobacterium necrophorum subsp. necrophorum]